MPHRQKLAELWRRVLEYGFFLLWLLSVAYGVIFAYLLLSVDTSTVGYGPRQTTVYASAGPTGPIASLGGLVLVALILYAILYHLIAAVGLYLDARNVRAADFDWNPRPGLYAVGGFFLSGLVVLHYLWKRYEHVPPKPSSRVWLPIVTLSVGGGILGLVGFAIPNLMNASMIVLFGFVPSLAFAIYHDAKRTSARTEWNPNPVTYFLSVLFTIVLLVGPYLVGGYYLYKRQQAA